MSDDERVHCLHPDPDKSAPRIERWKYDAVRKAILASVPDAEPGIAFRELWQLVPDKLEQRELEELGSLGWYLTTVKLDLEARSELKRLPGSPQRLVRPA